MLVVSVIFIFDGNPIKVIVIKYVPLQLSWEYDLIVSKVIRTYLAMRELFTSLFDKELKEREAEVQKQEKARQQKLIVTAPGINTPDQSKPSPSKNDVDEFLDKIHAYKKEHKEVDKKWLNELINEYNANFNEDFSQYLSLSKDVSAF